MKSILKSRTGDASQNCYCNTVRKIKSRDSAKFLLYYREKNNNQLINMRAGYHVTCHHFPWKTLQIKINNNVEEILVGKMQAVRIVCSAKGPGGTVKRNVAMRWCHCEVAFTPPKEQHALGVLYSDITAIGFLSIYSYS